MATTKQPDKDLERLLYELACLMSGKDLEIFSAKCKTSFQRLTIGEKELFRRLLGKLLETGTNAQGGSESSSSGEASQPSSSPSIYSVETTRNDGAAERSISTDTHGGSEDSSGEASRLSSSPSIYFDETTRNDGTEEQSVSTDTHKRSENSSTGEASRSSSGISSDETIRNDGTEEQSVSTDTHRGSENSSSGEASRSSSSPGISSDETIRNDGTEEQSVSTDTHRGSENSSSGEASRSSSSPGISSDETIRNDGTEEQSVSTDTHRGSENSSSGEASRSSSSPGISSDETIRNDGTEEQSVSTDTHRGSENSSSGEASRSSSSPGISSDETIRNDGTEEQSVSTDTHRGSENSSSGEASRSSSSPGISSDETIRNNNNEDEQSVSINAIAASTSQLASTESANGEGANSDVETNAPTDSKIKSTNFVKLQSIIPPHLRQLLINCIDTPGYFFTASEPHFTPIEGGVPDAFYRLYQRENCRDLLQIQRRFELRNLFLLIIALEYHTGNRWKWGALDDLSAEIKAQYPQLPLGTPEIRKYLERYVRFGHAYDKWVQNLGDPGYLIALPLKVTETEYIGREYSKCIPAAICRLRKLGIDKDVKDLRLSELAGFISKQLYSRTSEARIRPRGAIPGKASKRKRSFKTSDVSVNSTTGGQSQTVRPETAHTIIPTTEHGDYEAFFTNSNTPISLPNSLPTEVHIVNRLHKRPRLETSSQSSNEMPSQPGSVLPLNDLATNELSPPQQPGSDIQLNNLATNELSLPQLSESDLLLDDLSFPDLPTDWDQLFNLATKELSFPQQPGSDNPLNDLTTNELSPPQQPRSDIQLNNLATNELSPPELAESDLPLNGLSFPDLPTGWDQLFNLATNELSFPQQPGSDLPLNDLATNELSPPQQPGSDIESDDPVAPPFRWDQGPVTIPRSFNQYWQQPEPLSSPRSPGASESLHQKASYYPGRSIQVK
ncbi:unnamed protein product [Penicillium camemberti]|uniref:Str. FM013 n=1 Tax=Penicillium camemberti (strain FM 013) TaxID=1429867 RepID=A0A0G4NZJ5_PENC3|nr:unnamed protein product [Penicillium camemberti]